MSEREVDWLKWALGLQAIAQTGLSFSRDAYDRERYEELRALSARIFEAKTDTRSTASKNCSKVRPDMPLPRWTCVRRYSMRKIVC